MVMLMGTCTSNNNTIIIIVQLEFKSWTFPWNGVLFVWDVPTGSFTSVKDLNTSSTMATQIYWLHPKVKWPAVHSVTVAFILRPAVMFLSAYCCFFSSAALHRVVSQPSRWSTFSWRGWASSSPAGSFTCSTPRTLNSAEGMSAIWSS